MTRSTSSVSRTGASPNPFHVDKRLGYRIAQVCCFALLCGACSPVRAQAKTTTVGNMPAPSAPLPTNTGPGSATPLFPPSGSDDPYRNTSFVQRRLLLARQAAEQARRQKRVVDDTDRLLALSTEYRNRVRDHGTPTADDARLLDDIRKLAKSVRERSLPVCTTTTTTGCASF